VIKDEHNYYSTISFEKKPEYESKAQDELDEINKYEKAKENTITVDVNSDIKHPLAIKTAKSMRSAKSNEKGLYSPKAKNCIAVTVCNDSIDRSLNIVDALLCAIEKRGYKIEPFTIYNSELVCVNIDNVHLSITLEETVRRIDHVLTKEEEKKKSRDQWYHFRLPQYDYIPTGKLTLRLNHAWQYKGRTSWGDGKIQRVETCLNDFVISLRKAAMAIKHQQQEDERKEKDREIARLRKEAFDKNKADEEKRLNELIDNSASWKKSKLIREYVDTVKQNTISKNGEITSGSEVESWLIWATQQADRIDPLKESPFSILDQNYDEYEDNLLIK